MRKMKVRAWDTSTNTWVEGVTFTIHTSGNLLSIPDHIILTWTTGLKDKNGREIYEGDIVKAMSSDAFTKEIIAPVTFFGGSYQLGTPITGMRCFHTLGENPDIEVIGNFFENPEFE